MKKRGEFLVFVVVFSLVFLFQSVSSYEYDATNISFDSNQLNGEFLSGSFALSLLDAPTDLIFYSELGQITLEQLLINDGKTVGCENTNCSGLYTVIDSGSSLLKTTAIPSGVSYGLLFKGEGVSSSALDMTVSASFAESNKLPFSIAIGNDYRWYFDLASKNLSNFRQITYGCFNPAITLSEGNIDSNGYCEEVNLTDSKEYFLGANISGSGFEEFVFSLVQDGSELDACSETVEFARYNETVGCTLTLPEKQSSGKYMVCIRTQSEGTSSYKIKKENSGVNCGHYSSGSSLADYSLFVKVPFYASSTGIIDLGESFSSNSVDSINGYLSSVYNGECSNGCVVPIIFYGNDVALNISSIKSDYSSLTGPERSTKLYSLIRDAYRIDVFETISFKSFNWIVDFYGNKSLDVYLEGDGATNKLFSKEIYVKSVPFAARVYPVSAPAGIEGYFYAVVSGDFSKLIWNFGDGSSVIETNVSFAKHRYANISTEYNLTVTAIGTNSSISKYFTITTVSPENYINETLENKRLKFNKINSEVNGLPILYRDFVRNKLQLDSIQAGLVQIETDRVLALSSEDFLNIINKINLLDVPESISISESKIGSLSFTYMSINPSLLSEIIPGNYSLFEEYRPLIYGWQLKNINSSVINKKFVVTNEKNEKTELIVTYDINLKSKSEDNSYFIIQRPQSDIHFASGINSFDINGEATYIEIAPKQERTISFFIEGAQDSVMFVSPALDVLSINQEISACKIDDVCDRSNGENSDNCRSDCIPVLSTTLMICGLLFVLLVVYTLLQIWYVVKYEKYLFKDRSHVFNLLAFINNSKLNSKSSGDISSALVSSGWSHEQIEYAIKKSEGKNTGMFEILPVQKLIARMEMNKAEKIKAENVAPPINNSSTQSGAPARLSALQKPFPKRSMGNTQFKSRRDITKI